MRHALLASVAAATLLLACGGRLGASIPDVDDDPGLDGGNAGAVPSPCPADGCRDSGDPPPPLPGQDDASLPPTPPDWLEEDGGPSADPCARVRCGAAHGISECRGGQCVLVGCDEGYGNCDGNEANGCEPLGTFYEDRDGDGLGTVATPATTCQPPPGMAATGGDCDDDDARAFPGQTASFAAPRADGSFDFDCDGKDTRDDDNTSRYCLCGQVAGGPWQCGVSLGWKDSVPECGAEGQYVIGTVHPLTCDTRTEPRVQGCR